MAVDNRFDEGVVLEANICEDWGSSVHMRGM